MVEQNLNRCSLTIILRVGGQRRNRAFSCHHLLRRIKPNEPNESNYVHNE
ncbi:unnamed protein product [Musa textilis]